MSTRKKPSNFVQRVVKQVWRLFQSLTKALINWFLRSLFIFNRRSRANQAGFVLPTIVMVMLVVLLLTTAILFRSFNRPKNASNMRVDKATYAAAAPALDRARSKLEYLFSPEETGLKGNTPNDTSIAEVFEGSKYTYGDEEQLKLVAEFNGQDGIQAEEKLQTAWRFPVDTDGNGVFDSFTLYGVYFRTPPAPDRDNPNSGRKRGPIEARSLPQDEGLLEGCGSGGNGGSGDGWTVQSNGQLKKSFFTYVATVPITNTAGLGTDKPYEVYKGNKSFSGLEMQQDQARISLDNNAVWYRNDLEIIDPAPFKINGRVHTNGNLLVANNDGATIKFYQVSSPDSCYYKAENSKILVGGNVIAGGLTDSANRGNDLVSADLFRKGARVPLTFPLETTNINSSNVTTRTSPPQAASNNEAYDLRLNLLVKGAMNLHGQTTPQARRMPTKASVASMAGRFPQEEVIEKFNQKVDKCDPNCKDSRAVLENLIKRYFEARIRQVTNAEIPPTDSQTAIANLSPQPRNPNFVFAGGGLITAPRDWMVLDDSITKVPLDNNQLRANKPGGNNATEEEIGDRILVGNSLPTQWLKQGNGSAKEDYAKVGEPQDIPGGSWADGSGPRQRRSRVQPVTEIDDTSRNGYWESAAAFTGTPKEDNVQNPELLGGLRVITGAGIYIDGRGPAAGGTGKRFAEDTTPGKNDVRSFLPPPPTVEQLINKGVKLPQGILPRQLTVVWPESMPSYQWFFKDGPLRKRSDLNKNNIREAGEGIKGDLQMKATVVYHYASDANNPDRAPIACISSYYNNTDSFTADNANGISNNGFNYDAAGLVAQRAVTPRLQRQARMIFPDGRLVNQPLKEALDSLQAGGSLTLSETAAIDAANCALNILDNPGATSTSPIPDGAIKENAFLDARQVKALHKSEKLDGTGTPTVAPETVLTDITEPERLEIAELAELPTLTAARYDLPMEQRQPLEVRVTDIDLSRNTGINAAYGTSPGGAQEYLIPNSGIIYATRDDALADSSDPNGTGSATDFRIDPTREPYAIRLINGQNLARDNNFRREEKGLILSSDVPVYIKGDFNLHAAPGGGAGAQIEEFNTLLDNTYSNIYSRTRNDRNRSFACRQGGGSCNGAGDQWRAARILSDAVTIQSENFREGFRNEGDYDLNNNAGNWNVEPRLKNGFWWNSFATTAQWFDNTTVQPRDFDTIKANDQGSSYVTNSVTPIQRRTIFPAYLMEACLKKPVSACGPDDWYVGASGPNNLIKAEDYIKPGKRNNLDNVNTFFPVNNAGNTGTKAATGIFEGAVRRVAFLRGTNGQLVLDTNKLAQPIPATGGALQYGVSPTPTQQDNALWFWTTSDNASPHPSTGTVGGTDELRSNPSYNNTNLLYYEEALERVSDRQLFLPGIPEFPDPDGTNTLAQAINRLNGKKATDASDFAVCMNGGQASQTPTLTTLETTCLDGATAITQARSALTSLAEKAVNGETIVAVDKTLNNNKVQDAPPFPATGTHNLTATAKVNVYDLPDPRLARTTDLTITLDRGNQVDPIFVFRKKTGNRLTFGSGTSYGVKLNLTGVSPNNIFWVSNFGQVRINEGSATTKTTLVGNFIGRGTLTIQGSPTLQGVRFLGFNNTTPPAFPANTTAMTSTDEPLLVPVLQLHSPSGTPSAAPGAAFGDARLENTGWLPTATPTTVNAVLVMGDSPSRVIPSINSAESGGGLQNFPRFMERWTDQRNRINGSLIQFRRSSFATAPFEAIEDTTRDTSLFFDGTVPDYMVETGERDYRYRGGSASRKAPFYMPPERAWGYDVGLLSQSPDLFSKNFATPSAGSPNEYFREVGKDDEWIFNLRCAVLKDDTGTRALGNDAPRSCPPIGSYSN